MAELIKVHSLPGPDMIETPQPGGRRPDDFAPPIDPQFTRNPEISDFIRDVAGAKWVKVWISWFRIQNSFSEPASIWSSWAQLASAGNQYGNYFARLDALIKAINDEGHGAILQLDENFPRWATSDVAGKPRERVFPRSVWSDSPWGWWIAYLLCRYRLGVPANPTGPTQQHVYGNPAGAYLYGLEFCNEPNLLNYPSDSAGCMVALMFSTVESLAAMHWPYSGSFGGILLGPSTADGDTGDVRNWEPFMKSVLSYLDPAWQPRVYLGWSHHNYEDIDDTLLGGTGSKRLEGVRKRLQGGPPNDPNHPWRAGDRNVYLTEGAARQSVPAMSGQDLSSAQESNQVTMTRTAFARVRTLNNQTGGAYPLYAQHQINDVPWASVKYGLRRNWNQSEWAPNLRERPLAAVWRNLPS